MKDWSIDGSFGRFVFSFLVQSKKRLLADLLKRFCKGLKGWALMIGVQNGYRLKVAKLADQDVVPWKVCTRTMRIFVRFRFHFRHNSVTSGSFSLKEGAGVESLGRWFFSIYLLLLMIQ